MTPDFFIQNRKRLAQKLDGGVVVLAGFDAMQRTNDMPYPFWQEAHFWYLTGIEHAGWRMIYDGTRDHLTLVKPHLSDVEKIFDGDIDEQAVLERAGAQSIISMKEFEAALRHLARTHSVVYSLEFSHRESYSFAINPAPGKVWSLCQRVFSGVRDCERDIARLRAIKQPVEIQKMRAAAKLTMKAFEAAKKIIPHTRYEYEIAAEMSYVFAREKACHAYDPIVASGKNACTLHYIENSAKVSKKSFILMDVGAQKEYYASDVTRTYAVGDVSSFARDVHEGVSQAQKEIVSMLKPGLGLEEYSRNVDACMMRTMSDLGLISSTNDEKGYRTYMPHSVSHGLGIDTHDSLGRASVLREGMVLTVEPGIYIPEKSIGVRIEDDILITKNGHENLTGKLSTDWCV